MFFYRELEKMGFQIGDINFEISQLKQRLCQRGIGYSAVF